MKKLLALFLAVFTLNVSAAIEPMFEFDVREDRSTAQENTGKEYPLIPADYRQVQYVGTYNTDTKAIVIEKSFVVAGASVPVEPIPTDPTPIEPDPIEPDPNLITGTNTPQTGEWVEVSNNVEFTELETQLFHQYINEDLLAKYPEGTKIITIVGSDANANYGYWRFGRTLAIPVSGPAIIVTDVFEGTTKDQVLGLLTQFNTLFSDEPDLTVIEAIAKKLRSIADLFGKADEVKVELEALRKAVGNYE